MDVSDTGFRWPGIGAWRSHADAAQDGEPDEDLEETEEG
jgi:hypothetical protein